MWIDIKRGNCAVRRTHEAMVNLLDIVPGSNDFSARSDCGGVQSSTLAHLPERGSERADLPVGLSQEAQDTVIFAFEQNRVFIPDRLS